MSKKIKKYLVITGVIFGIGVIVLLINAWSLIGSNPEKMWLHRCNSLEKWEEMQHGYDNFEVDVVWRDSIFDVTHDVDVTFNQRLEPFLSQLKHNKNKMWIDAKNLNATNWANATQRLDFLLEKYDIDKSRFIIESSSVDALHHLNKNGYYTSYYIDFPNPDDLDDNQVEDVVDSIENVVEDGCCDAISFPYWWYDELEDEFDDNSIDMLTWCHRTTQFEFFLTPWCYEMLNDSQVKVILVKDKGSYHR